MTRAAVSHRFEPAVTHRIAAKTAGRTLQPATPKTQPSAFSSRKQTTTTTRPAKKQQDGHGPQPPRRLAHQLRRRRRRHKRGVRPVIERVEGGAKKADAAEAQRQAELDEKNREWTAYLNSPEYAQEQQKKRKQLEDAFQVLRRRFLREHGARFGLEVPPPSSSDDDEDDDDDWTCPKRPFNPQGGAMLEAASRVLADPDAPRSRQEAVEQVMAATEALAAGRGIGSGGGGERPPRARAPEAEARTRSSGRCGGSQDGATMRREERLARRPRGARRRSGRRARARGALYRPSLLGCLGRARRLARPAAAGLRDRTPAPPPPTFAVASIYPAGPRPAASTSPRRPPPPGCRRRASRRYRRAPLTYPRASSRPRRTRGCPR